MLRPILPMVPIVLVGMMVDTIGLCGKRTGLSMAHDSSCCCGGGGGGGCDGGGGVESVDEVAALELGMIVSKWLDTFMLMVGIIVVGWGW